MNLPRYTKKDIWIMTGVTIPWVIILNALMFGPVYFSSWSAFASATLITGFVIVASWQLFTLIAVTLRERFPKEGDNVKRLIISIFIFVLITALIITLLYGLYDSFNFLNCEFYVSNYRAALVTGAFVNVFVTLLHEAVMRFERWKTAIVENELLKKEYMQSQLLGLKSQINPHFLFNSLNTLSCLINEDEEEADHFLDEMSKVYRYLLRSNDEELVTLNTELHFIESYFYLLKMRHGKSIELKINVTEDDKNKLMPPLTLQMLLENTLFDNVGTKDNPIETQINSGGNDWLEVSNTVHKKTDETNMSESISNIANKFLLLCQKEVEINEDEWHRTIRLPLINETKMQVA